MSGLREIALGVTQVLQGMAAPEPLPVDLWNQTPAEATYLLRRVIDECADAGVVLALVRIAPAMAAETRHGEEGAPHAYRGVPVERDPSLKDRIEFYRHQPK